MLAGSMLSGCFLLKPLPGKPIVVEAYTLPARPVTPAHLLAGAGRADITPLPGYPTGGDGPAGNLSRGYWTRLYARAYFFMDRDGHTLVLVSCDLFAIPGGLTAMAARNVATKWSAEGIAIPPEAIVIAATHTHQGPGNYLSSRTYNGYASKYGGFSLELFNFLVKGVTDAIDRAIADAWDHRGEDEPALSIRTGRVTAPIQLNRSPRTFLLNWNSRTIMDGLHPNSEPLVCLPDVETGEARNDWDLPDCPRLRAADPAMTLLEIRRGTDCVGLLVFFAVHPTALDTAAPFYSADFVGYALARLEREMPVREGGRAAVVAFFNGAEGDVVTRRGQRDVVDVARLGDMLVESVRLLQAQDPVPLARPSIETKRDVLGPSASCKDQPEVHLTDAPVPGVAVLGGGEGDRTSLYRLGWRAGVRDIARDGQGPKKPALDSPILPALQATSILAGPETFPAELPIHYVRIGSLALGAFPAELSTATADKIRGQLGAHGRFEIVGLANEYTSYVASPNEYAAQDYMAASTLWGPWEGPLFGCRMSELAASSAGALPVTVGRKSFSPGLRPEQLAGGFALGPTAVGEARVAPDEEMERVLLDAQGAPERALPYFAWTESVENPKVEFYRTADRAVAIQVRRDGQWIPRPNRYQSPDNDRGSNFVTMMTEGPRSSAEKQRHWGAIWLAPVLEPAWVDEVYRFEVNTGSGTLFSCPFRVDLTGHLPPAPIPPPPAAPGACPDVRAVP